MATAIRSKENDCDFPLFKTPLRTPIRNSTLSSATLNDLAFHSNNIKHLKFAGTTSMNDLQMCNDTMTTPIRLNKIKFSTPGSIQRRRALGLVNYNSNQICHVSSSDDLSILTNKHDEPVILQAPAPKMTYSHPQDDLPHESKNNHCYADTFEDLIPTNERVERMVTNQTNGVNIFAFSGGIENTIRYQSPQCSRVNLSTLLDILN